VSKVRRQRGFNGMREKEGVTNKLQNCLRVKRQSILEKWVSQAFVETRKKDETYQSNPPIKSQQRKKLKNMKKTKC
jgi:hypothetical protein